MLAHEKRKRAIGTSMVTHAHMLGSRSSGGPVIRCPQQQKVLRAGHTMYERSMVFGCGGVAALLGVTALLVALSARARSTKPAEGGGVQGGTFGLMDRFGDAFGVLGIPPACVCESAMRNRYTYGKQIGARHSAALSMSACLSPPPRELIRADAHDERATSHAAWSHPSALVGSPAQPVPDHAATGLQGYWPPPRREDATAAAAAATAATAATAQHQRGGRRGVVDALAGTHG